MNKFLVNLCCVFIWKKRNRKHFRKKYITKSKYEILLDEINQLKSKVVLKDTTPKFYAIKGNNNTIILIDNTGKEHIITNKTKLINGLNLSVNGDNNVVKFNFFEGKQLTIKVIGNNNEVNSFPKSYKNLNIDLATPANSRKLIINQTTTIGSAVMRCKLTNHKIIIGKECMLGDDILIRTDDAHAIFEKGTKNIINKGGDVIISDHVWIAYKSFISKNVFIGANNIIGARSLVTKSFYEENVIIAGIPAKIVKENIEWDRHDAMFFEEKTV